VKTLRTLLRGSILLPLLYLAPARADTPVPASPDQIEKFIALARSDLRELKSTILAQNMILTGEESARFWPLQREYDAAATELGGRRVELIRRLLEKGGTYSDAEAKKLAREVFALEHERTKLKETWFKKFLTAIPATKVARYFQIENQLNAIIDLRVAAELPLIH
jgi:hypothetical protein